MRRDTYAIAAGVVYAAVGLTYLLGGGNAVGRNGGWIAPLLVVVLGVLGLTAAVTGHRRSERDADRDAAYDAFLDEGSA